MPNKIKEQITDGILHLTLCNTRGNILDGEMMGEITSAIEGATRDPHIKAITFRGEGDHFSFGASVPEHQKDRVAEMLASFHKLF
ncbi:MAG TPA: cyclohexa-1,5-dienecarbonyl-CoA hydratase, partial [bacterium]|nr:cyclohexa-1,5-dienecarbonyl-CoA hydratase [bacterium]